MKKYTAQKINQIQLHIKVWRNIRNIILNEVVYKIYVINLEPQKRLKIIKR